MDKLRIYDVFWESHTAGPSPDNNTRTEVFLAGCKMAAEGNPCKGCFNPSLWNGNRFIAECTPDEAFENIEKYARNEYITFVGGEPLDQIKPLLALCRKLKKAGYHIIIFTHYLMKEIMEMEWGRNLLCNVDVVVDGKFEMDKKIYDDINYDDGFHNAIGSGNQVVWDMTREIGIPASDLKGINVPLDHVGINFLTIDNPDVKEVDLIACGI